MVDGLVQHGRRLCLRGALRAVHPRRGVFDCGRFVDLGLLRRGYGLWLRGRGLRGDCRYLDRFIGEVSSPLSSSVLVGAVVFVSGLYYWLWSVW